MKHLFRIVYVMALALGTAPRVPAAEVVTLSRADYLDRVNAIWHGQIVAVLLTLPFEHRAAAVEAVRGYPKPYREAFVDDDWYYEMCAVRAFEKHGIGLTVEQLGEQWLANSCGSWGSSRVALANLKRGIKAPATGHPRYNRLWWTIGPVFTADLYGALAPGMPNEAARMARTYCAINGYGEALDGAVLYAGAISLGFVERDVKTVLRRAVTLVHPGSPYRQCVEGVIRMAENGSSFEQVVAAVEDRWRIEYPASNNAVANGGLTAACLWFGGGDFWKTVDLACRAADFSDTDNSAATAVAILAAMHGMKVLPADLVTRLNDRIVGKAMGGVPLTPPVDEQISVLARRTAAIGEKVIAARRGRVDRDTLTLRTEDPTTQPAVRFELADLMKFWNPDWRLERAGFGGDDVGAMPGIRGLTGLLDDTLVTYPRDEARGLVLRRTMKLGSAPVLAFEAGADAGKAWELTVFAGNRLLLRRLISGGETGQSWHPISVDLRAFAGHQTTLRLYQRVLLPGQAKVPGSAYWRGLIIR